MDQKRLGVLFLTAALVAGCVSRASRDAKTTAAPPMSPEQQQQMMEKMTALAAPGEGHKRLQPLVGKFKTSGTFWMAPGEPPTLSAGMCTNTWVVGDRFVRQDQEAEFQGEPYRGTGFTGFNNATGQYEAVWIDSMGTFIMPMSKGTVDASGKVFTFSRTMDDPMTGQSVTTREVLTIQSADSHTFEWYQRGPDGKETLMFRIEYTRVP